MNESELYQELGVLTKNRSKWKESIPYVSSLLNHESVKIQAKALWMLGEMGLVYPQSVQEMVPTIAAFLDNPEPLLRERAVNALGRIGRGSFQVIEPYWGNLFRFAEDEDAKVRLSFIWASENIATNSPDLYERYMPVFGKLCTMQMTKSGWKRRKCSAFSANAGLNSSDRSWINCRMYRKQTAIVSYGFTAWVQ